MACRDTGKPVNCRRRGLVYETSCLECLDKEGQARARYVGETSRSLAERYSEHVNDGEKGAKSSNMFKHWQVHHGGKKTNFKVEVIGFFTSALERQVAESVRIDMCGAERILNSKSVFSRCMVPRLVAVDTVEEPTLGDKKVTMEELDDDVFEEEETRIPFMTGDKLRKSEDRKKRKEKRIDTLRWGISDQENAEDEVEIDLINILTTMFQEEENRGFFQIVPMTP